MELKKLAMRMRAFALANPVATDDDGQPAAGFDPALYRMTLSGGLRIVLYITAEREWRLSAYRPGTFPGETELWVLRRDFDIPAEAAEARLQVPSTAPESEQWHIVKVTWVEARQEVLFELPAVEPPAKYF